MSLISAKGNEAAKSAAKSSVNLDEVMIRPKDGDSIRVRLLSTEDYVEYKAVSGFNLGVYTQPSREPLGETDYFVEASKLADSGKVDEKFKVLYPKSRYLIAMADVDTGIIRIWDASRTQFNKFISDMKEYEDIISDPEEELLFTFKRTGKGTDTAYSLSPVVRMKKEDKEAFHQFDGKVAEIELYESVLQPRSPKMQVSILKEAGFPVEQYFPEIDLSDSEDAATTEDEASPLDSI